MSKRQGERSGRVNTWEMVVVHRMFRREFRILPDIVRAVENGDHDRAEIVGGHLSDVCHGLHHHHHGEDKLLWPLLLERAGTLNEDLVHRMEGQHAVLSSALSQMDALLPRWRSTADATTRDELAAVVAEASTALDEHLTEEETYILPLVSQHLTPAEWKALGDHGKSGMPKGAKGFVFLGGILEDASADEREAFLGMLPAPVRAVWRVVGNRIHRRAMARVRGTA